MNRDDLLRRFEQWLDEALAVEEPPAGIDAEMLAALADANPKRTMRSIARSIHTHCGQR